MLPEPEPVLLFGRDSWAPPDVRAWRSRFSCGSNGSLDATSSFHTPWKSAGSANASPYRSTEIRSATGINVDLRLGLAMLDSRLMTRSGRSRFAVTPQLLPRFRNPGDPAPGYRATPGSRDDSVGCARGTPPRPDAPGPAHRSRIRRPNPTQHCIDKLTTAALVHLPTGSAEHGFWHFAGMTIGAPLGRPGRGLGNGCHKSRA